MWKKGITDGYSWEALVFDNPSRFGINEGRISKLCIWPGTPKMGTEIYQYDRGLVEDKCPAGLLEKVLAEAIL